MRVRAWACVMGGVAVGRRKGEGTDMAVGQWGHERIVHHGAQLLANGQQLVWVGLKGHVSKKEASHCGKGE